MMHLGLPRRAINRLHHAGRPRRDQHFRLARADAELVLGFIAIHAEWISNLLCCGVDDAVGEDVCDVQLFPFRSIGDYEIGGRRERPADNGAHGAVGRVHGVDGRIRHVRDVDRAVLRDGEVVEGRRECGDDRDGLCLHVDAFHLARLGVYGVEVSIGPEIGGGGNLEASCDDRVLAGGGIDLHDGVLEPQWTIKHAVRPDLEAVEAAEVLADEACRLRAGDVRFVERITEEDLREVELALLREGQ